MGTTIIAEAGVNHNGNIDLAKQLIEVAAESGADYVKFQTFKADTLVTKFAAKAEYQLRNGRDVESQYEMLKQLELGLSDFQDLLSYAKFLGINVISTAFDIESAESLFSLGQRFFKIPSGEITNLPYLRHIGSFKTAIAMSTGMSNMSEIKAALDILESAGTPKTMVTVLHCTSAYPTPFSEVNLIAMRQIRKTFDVAVGYSDHTLGSEVAIAAVAQGASVIEKHFTLDKTLPGPDHKASLNPEELKSLVKSIRNVELAMGDGIKCATPSEMKNLNVTRKSIVANCDIAKGELFSVKNLTTKRPGIGISPMEWDRIIGQKAHRNFKEDELIDEA